MEITNWLGSFYSELKQWSIHHWNAKKMSSRQWRKSFFYFHLLSGVLHSIAALIIIPQVYDALSDKIPVWDYSGRLFLASSILFLVAGCMETYLELTCFQAKALKVVSLYAVVPGILYAYASCDLSSIWYNFGEGDDYWWRASLNLFASRICKIILITKLNPINDLIAKDNAELMLEAKMALIGLVEWISSELFIQYAFNYQLYYYATACLVLSSLLRIITALQFHCAFLASKADSQNLKQIPIDQSI